MGYFKEYCRRNEPMITAHLIIVGLLVIAVVCVVVTVIGEVFC